MSTRLEAALAELAAAIRDEVATAAAPAGPDRLWSIAQAAAQLGIGRTALYREMQAGRVRSIRVGRRRLLPASGITERIEAATAPNGDGQEVRRAAARPTPTT